MAAKVASQNFQPDSDVHITYDDQQKINKFAKNNARIEDYKAELEMKKNSLKNLEEAAEELELFDDEEQIPFLIGEVFMCNNLSKTQDLLKMEKEKKQKECKEIEVKIHEIQQIMNELKAQLYHRFGSNISLENDE